MGALFNPVASATLAASGTSSRVALPTTLRGGQGRTVRVLSQGPDTVFIAFGSSTVAATVAGSVPVSAGLVEVFDAPPGITHMAAITEGGAVVLRLTIGEGE